MKKRTTLALTFIASLLSVVEVNAQNNKLPDWVESIYAPKIVGVPPSDAYIGLSLMDDGEIRHYNYGEQKVDESPYYLSTRDYGKTWKQMRLTENMPYADKKSPISDEYIRVFVADGKVYCMRTTGGIDGDRTIKMIDDQEATMIKPPIFVDGGKKIVVAASYFPNFRSFTYISTDDGLTWERSNLVTAPAHEVKGHHKSFRWQNGATEPTVAELSDGTLWMVMRTSQDCHYQSFSTDGGLTWSESTPSPFYATITMPTFLKLEDGRLLFFWCNTTPLPEVEGNDGVWDDVFTNRNATHIAISEDDGKTWIGCRELYLDERRNAENFGTMAGIDKSVHQAQAVQISEDKVFASIGQNHLNRKMVIFDVDWLYETERETHFEDSLKSISAFRYYSGIVGHCGYNRQEMPILVQHPDKEGANAVNIRYVQEEKGKFVADNQGMVWNFPAAREGEVELSVKIPAEAKSVDLILNDRWMNPTDTVAKEECQYTISLDRKTLKIKDDKWHTVKVEWGYNQTATVYVDNKKVAKLDLIRPTIHGLSYVHLLGGYELDEVGLFVESIKAKAN